MYFVIQTITNMQQIKMIIDQNIFYLNWSLISQMIISVRLEREFWPLCAHYILKFNLGAKFFNTTFPRFFRWILLFVFYCHIGRHVNSK